MHTSAYPWYVETSGRSLSYQGRHAVTKDGEECQRWDAQTPNSHKYIDARYHPDATLEEAGNYCRGMGNRWPWCYTVASQRWNYCGILELLCDTSKCELQLKIG